MPQKALLEENVELNEMTSARSAKLTTSEISGVAEMTVEPESHAMLIVIEAV